MAGAFSVRHGVLLVVGVLVQGVVHGVGAIPPPYVADGELAGSPIIVVGRWEKAEFTKPVEVGGGEQVRRRMYSAQTTLVVERVIKGELKAGKHPLLLGFRIGWPDKDGGPVMSFMSTEMVGDVREVKEANLWFLHPRRADDAADKTVYLALETYRGVQPVVLEKYFLALGSKEPKAEVPKLLASDDPVVAERVLTYVSGGPRLPWPYEPDEWEARGLPARSAPLREQTPAVERLLGAKDAATRRLAAAVYADLVGAAAGPRLRLLVRDPDGGVRAVAVGLLVRGRDREVGPVIAEALRGLKDGGLACQVIEVVRRSSDPAAVPGLIEFLEDDTYSYRYGDDLGVPALKAAAALKELTGHDFPMEVASSRKAWEKARLIGDAKERLALLAKELPWDPRPLAAELRREATGPVLLLTNRTRKALVVGKEPAGISYDWTNGGGGGASRKESVRKEDFTTLQPGESLRVPLKEEWARAENLTRVSASFLNNGHEVGLNAWIGEVAVTVEAKR
jgi:hypothetical protein